MKVDISQILKVNGSSLNVEFNELLESFNTLHDDLAITNPVSFTGTFVNIGGLIKLDGKLEAYYTVKCSRCLKNLNSRIDLEIKEEFIEEGKQKEDEIYTYQGKSIELDKVLSDNIILNLPSKQVCDNNCKGLCPVCGIDLNVQDCKCKEESTDPRMEALKDFFKN